MFHPTRKVQFLFVASFGTISKNILFKASIFLASYLSWNLERCARTRPHTPVPTYAHTPTLARTPTHSWREGERERLINDLV